MTSGLRTLLLIGFAGGIAIAIMGIAVFQLNRGIQQEPVLEVSFVFAANQQTTCPNNTCETTFVINEDGSFVHTDTARKETGGLVNLQRFVNLQNAITEADFAALLQNRRQTPCRTLSQETQATYTFYQNGQEYIISSCEVQIAYGSELFQSVSSVQQDITDTVSQRQ